MLQKGTKQKRVETYQSEDQQSRFFKEKEEECHLWLTQNLHHQKTSSIMSILKQIVETRYWKATQGLIEDGKCQLCHGHDETVQHLVTGGTVLSKSEYFARHNRVLMILAATWAKEHKLIGADMV